MPLPALAFEHPADAMGEIDWVVGSGQVAGAPVLDHIGQAGGVEGHHGHTATLGFGGGMGEVVHPGGHHHYVGSGVEQSQRLGPGPVKIRRKEVGNHPHGAVGQQRRTLHPAGQPVAGGHDVNRPALGATFAQPGPAVEVGPGFMARAAGGPVVHREALITAGCFGKGGAIYSPDAAQIIAWCLLIPIWLGNRKIKSTS